MTQVADDLKARDITILDLKGICTFADYFVIASVDSRTQMRAIMRDVLRRLSDEDLPNPMIDGKQSDHWMVADLGDIVVHLFDPATRVHYNLTSLWGDAASVDMANFLTA